MARPLSVSRSSAYRSLLLTSAIVVLTYTSASAQQLRQEVWVPNGTVSSVVATQDRIYVAGYFDLVGPSVGALGVVDKTGGAIVAPSLEVAGQVNAIAPDGSGGWFIAGSFTHVLGQPRNCLARINANGTLSAWNPSISPGAIVNTLVLSGGILYVGGWFTSLGGEPRQHVGALDPATGVATAWNPSANGQVYAIAVNGNTVYAGGIFWTIGGASRLAVAAIDATSGLATAWNPTLASGLYEPLSVRAIALRPSTNTIYIGGEFASVGGFERPYLAGINATTGVADGFTPNPDGPVYDILIRFSAESFAAMYVGGGFNNIGGEARDGFAALDGLGAATTWDPASDGPVISMALDGQTLYVGGYFRNIGGQARTRLAALDINTAQATAWNPRSGFAIEAIGVGPNDVFVGGSGAGSIGGQDTHKMIALDAATGELIEGWDPNPDNSVFTLAISGNTVYAGGHFTNIGGQARNRIAAIDGTTGQATDWNPDASSYVSELLVSGNSIYALGGFGNIGGQWRYPIAELDLTTGLATNWYPNPQGGGPGAIAVVGDLVYLAGYFTSIGGQPRQHLAAVSRITGVANGWNPQPDFACKSLATDGTRVYVGGEFTTISGQPRSALAAYQDGVLLDWTPNPNDDVLSMQVVGDVLYAGGWFSTMDGETRQRLCSLHAPTGSVTDWIADVAPSAWVSSYGGMIFAYGQFVSVGSEPRNALAVFTNAPTGIDDTPSIAPAFHVLASPNPFTGNVSLSFNTNEAANVEVEVYDVAGHLVRRLHSGALPSGEQRLSWDGRNDAGIAVGSGAYFTRVRAGAQRTSTKVLLIR